MTLSRAVITTFSWGTNGLYARGSYQYLYDPQGSVSVRTNSSGQVVGYDLFDAYGTARQLGTSEYAHYNGQWGYLRLFGLYLCTYRFYDQAKGRWVNRDPIGYDGGVNLYGYCGSQPIDGRDPRGLQRLPDLVTAQTTPEQHKLNATWRITGLIQIWFGVGTACGVPVEVPPIKRGSIVPHEVEADCTGSNVDHDQCCHTIRDSWGSVPSIGPENCFFDCTEAADSMGSSLNIDQAGQLWVEMGRCLAGSIGDALIDEGWQDMLMTVAY